MISTATAAVNAAAAEAPDSKPAGEGQRRDRDHDRNEDGRDAIREPLHGSLAGLSGLDEARDLSDRSIGADSRRANDEAAVGVDGCSGNRGADADLDRYRLAGQQRLVDS